MALSPFLGPSRRARRESRRPRSTAAASVLFSPLRPTTQRTPELRALPAWQSQPREWARLYSASTNHATTRTRPPRPWCARPGHGRTCSRTGLLACRLPIQSPATHVAFSSTAVGLSDMHRSAQGCQATCQRAPARLPGGTGDGQPSRLLPGNKAVPEVEGCHNSAPHASRIAPDLTRACADSGLCGSRQRVPWGQSRRGRPCSDSGAMEGASPCAVQTSRSLRSCSGRASQGGRRRAEGKEARWGGHAHAAA